MLSDIHFLVSKNVSDIRKPIFNIRKYRLLSSFACKTKLVKIASGNILYSFFKIFRLHETEYLFVPNNR